MNISFIDSAVTLPGLWPIRSYTGLSLLVGFLLAASPKPVFAASIADCQGYGGAKFCFVPDNNQPEGRFIQDLSSTNACANIGVAGGKAHYGSNYEIVAPNSAPTLSGKLNLVNYCTKLPAQNGSYPKLYAGQIGCSANAYLVNTGGSWICVPRDVTPDKNAGKKCSTQCGNPINFATGNKFQEEVDYDAPNGFSFVRSYNSSPTPIEGDASDIGANWRHNYKYILKVAGHSLQVAKAYRPDGRAYSFANTNPADPMSKWVSENDVRDILTRLFDDAGNPAGWEYRRSSDDATESYNAEGKILRIAFRDGDYQLFSYSDAETPPTIAPKPGLLIRVADRHGRFISFRYDSQGRIANMIDPTGSEYAYTYDEASAVVDIVGRKSNNLTSVTYPDGKRRTYWYNEANMTYQSNFLTGLTGITDENGDRFATFRYDSSRRAISTEHGAGVQRYSIMYDSTYQQTTVTEPLGAKRIYGLTAITQVVRNLGEKQLNATGKGIKARTFDTNGNVSSQTDFAGTRTEFTYDLTRNLETKRVEAVGTPYTRTITTLWHGTYRLPIRIVEPLRVTNFTYDVSGNLTLKTVQSTNDTTGAQGADPAVTGPVKSWKYNHNAAGQLLMAADPAGAETQFSYDEEGNLSTVTNPLGQMTIYEAYDRNGRAGRIRYPNGVTEEMTYTLRGWLETRAINDRQWRYAYDGVGQLKLMTAPDGTSTSYTYDLAHRLIRIEDSLGNSIVYTLDAQGNRITEEVKDPAGALVRKVTRSYNSLNQLNQQIGGGQ